MNQSSAMNPAQRKLLQAAGAWNQARVQKNPFKNRIDVPDGTYYARVSKARLTLTQAKDPMATITCIILCDENGRIIDDDGRMMAGEQARIMHLFKPTERQTLADRMARFCYDLQAMNYDTSALEIHEIEAALAQVEADRKFVVLTVKTADDGQRQFVNVLEETTESTVNAALEAAGNPLLTADSEASSDSDTESASTGTSGLADEFDDGEHSESPTASPPPPPPPPPAKKTVPPPSLKSAAAPKKRPIK